MKKILVTMMVLALTIGAQAQQYDGINTYTYDYGHEMKGNEGMLSKDNDPAGDKPVSIEALCAFIRRVAADGRCGKSSARGSRQRSAFIDNTIARCMREYGIPETGWVTRGDYAVLLDQCLHPFEMRDVDLEGRWK